MSKTRSIFGGVGLSVLALIPFFYWLARYIQLDFWYDEVYTLENFVFTPWVKITTRYVSPNNHIFFNLLNHLYVSLLKIPDPSALMSHPVYIRGLMLVYTLLTLGCVAAIGSRFFNRNVTVLALVLLVTTVPYNNFTLQVRGYSLSILLAAVIVYFLLACWQHSSWVNTLALLAASTLFLYVIPSNLYFIGSLVFIFGLSGARQFYTGALKSFSKSLPRMPWRSLAKNCLSLIPIRVTLILAGACGLAGVLYLPVLPGMLGVGVNQNELVYSLKTRLLLFPRTLDYFLSFRYLLLLGVILGLVAGWRVKNRSYLIRSMVCLAVIILPFLVNFVVGAEPLDRIFIVGVIPFVLLIAFAMDVLIQRTAWLANRSGLVLALAILYCQGTFIFAMNNRDATLAADIHHAQTSQNIFYNYYQAYYQPRKVLSTYMKVDPSPLKPLYILYYGDAVAIPDYLANDRIASFKVASVSEIKLDPANPTYVLTAYQDLFLRSIEEAYPGVSCQPLMDQPEFVNLFNCTPPLEDDPLGAAANFP